MKALLLLANGFEEVEALTVVDILRRADTICDICSITNNSYVLGAHKIEVRADIMIRDTVADDYDAVILPGGQRGTDNLASDPNVRSIILKMNSDNKLCAAVCAAPTVFVGLGIADGHRLTSYPGKIVPSDRYDYCEDSVVTDGNIITSRGAGTTYLFAHAILSYFGLKNIASNITRDMMY